jgi:DNA polymerase III epsilon subunit-like protein
MADAAGKYLLIDTETTGLHPARHGLIELAAAALDAQLTIIETFQADVCPPEGFAVDEEALQINGFTLERISKGITYKELCETFLAFIKKHFASDPVVIGQFYPFDYAFLDKMLSESGYSEGIAKTIPGNDFIDSKALAMSMNLAAHLRGKPVPFPSTSLSRPGGLREKLGIVGYQAHTALGDVLATREVLIKLLDMI